MKTNMNQDAQRAMLAMQAGDFATAAACFDRLGKAARTDEKLANAAAFAYIQLGNDDRAFDYLKASLKIRSAQADVNVILGDIYLRRLDQDNSLKHMRRAVALEPKSPEIRFKLAEALIGFESFSEAVVELQAAIEMKPQYIQARLSLVRSLMGLDKLEDAETELQRADELAPGNNAVAFRRGKLREKQQRLNDAIEIYKKVDVDTSHAGPVCEALALAELACGNTEAALATLRRGLKKNPLDRNLLRHSAELRYELGDPKAFSHYEQALVAAPVPSIHSDFISYLIQSKSITEAMIQLQRYKSGVGADPSWAALTTELLYGQGKFEEALETMVQVPAPDHELMTWKAKCLIGRGDATAAQAVLLELLEKAPYDQYVLALLATCYRLNESPAYQELVNYDNLLIQTELDVPAGFTNLAAFNEALRETVEELHVMRSNPVSQSVMGGTQTPGNLLNQPHPVIQALKQAFQSTMTREFGPEFYNKIGETHPVSVGHGRALTLPAAWSIWVTEGGYHRSHVHTKGWYSSAYYVSLPSEMKAAGRSGNDGKLAFGRPELATPVPLEAERMITPVEGVLTLFPSYFWHETMPFKSSEPRVAVAFDALPARQEI